MRLKSIKAVLEAAEVNNARLEVAFAHKTRGVARRKAGRVDHVVFDSDRRVFVGLKEVPRDNGTR